MTTRFAVLVDGDNIGAQHAARIRQIALARGTPDIWRVYADATQRTTWDDTPGFRLVHAGTGKNAADVLLAIDAMELALRDGVAKFVIVSSDGDFSHLALRLRETGCQVIGIGEGKAPAALRAACTGFELVGESKTKSAPDTLDCKISAIVTGNGAHGKGIRIASLGLMMQRSHSVGIDDLPDKNWREYLENRGHLYDLDPKGADARVRIKSSHLRAV